MNEQRVTNLFDIAVMYLLGQPLPPLPAIPGKHYRPLGDGDGRDRVRQVVAALSGVRAWQWRGRRRRR